tara:strand:- start:248 stop:862 length:615 start_codon:yes stop_codon:yes gene_type:complete
LFFFSKSAYAHTFIGMVGFFDGISHPVLGFDHFIAMVSVGIISAQIGGRAIWTIPTTFVFIMIIGGIIGIYAELNQISQSLKLINIENQIFFADFLFMIIEIGILISVIALGLIIAIEKILSVQLIITAVGIFGFFHGSAHGLEMPQAINPIFFALGFAVGTSILHIFGLIIGHYLIKTKLSTMILRVTGIFFACIGLYSIINL